LETRLICRLQRCKVNKKEKGYSMKCMNRLAILGHGRSANVKKHVWMKFTSFAHYTRVSHILLRQGTMISRWKGHPYFANIISSLCDGRLDEI
jgi:hypothetical protein